VLRNSRRGGTLMLTPEWMLRPAAANREIRAARRLCPTRLRDLRVYLDATASPALTTF